MKRTFPKILFKWCSAFVLAGVLFAGCKKYDDDIDRLQESIDANESAMSALDQIVKSGAVVTSVSQTANGVTLNLSNGQTYTISNGADGADGVDGVDGTDGAPGSVIAIDGDGEWTIDGTKTGVMAEGEDGDQGPKGDQGDQGPKGDQGIPGHSPVITIQNGEWHIDGSATGVQAYPGDIAVVENPDFYEVVFTSSTGVATDKIRLPRVSLFVTSLSLVPKNVAALSNHPVIAFPQIVDGGNPNIVLYKGAAPVTFKFNPSSVGFDYFKVLGFAAKKADVVVLKAAADIVDDKIALSGHDVSANYQDGELKFKAWSNGFQFSNNAPLFGEGPIDMIALVVENTGKYTENDAAEKIVVSQYVQAGIEEISENNVTIEKIKKGSDVNRPYLPDGSSIQESALYMPLLTSGSQATITAAPDIHFRLHYVDDSYLNTDGGYNLADSLRGFFVRILNTNRLYSLDDNGFDDYTLKFTKANYLQPAGSEDTKQYIDILDAATGKIRVAEDPLNPGAPNAAAIGKNPVIKVDLVAPNNNIIATRWIKLEINKTYQPPVALAGTLGLTLTDCDVVGGGFVYDMDDVYNKTGLSKAEFNSAYTFTAVSVPAGFDINSLKPDPTDENKIEIDVPKTTKPGTYVAKGKFTASGYPDVNFTGTITVNAPAFTLGRNTSWWNAEQSTMLIHGREDGMGGWEMTARLWDGFQLSRPTYTGSCGTSATVDVKFVLAPGQNGVSIVEGADTVITLANSTAGRSWVDRNAVTVYARIFINGTFHESVTFNVLFQNPVLPIVERNPHHQLEDKKPAVTYDLHHSIALNDYTGAVLYNKNNYNNGGDDVDNNALRTLYGANSGFVFSFVEARNNNGDLVDVTTGSMRVTVDPVTGIVEWENTGADIQQEITLTFKIEQHNTWNEAEFSSTDQFVEPEFVKVKVLPLP